MYFLLLVIFLQSLPTFAANLTTLPADRPDFMALNVTDPERSAAPTAMPTATEGSAPPHANLAPLMAIEAEDGEAPTRYLPDINGPAISGAGAREPAERTANLLDIEAIYSEDGEAPVRFLRYPYPARNHDDIYWERLHWLSTLHQHTNLGKSPFNARQQLALNAAQDKMRRDNRFLFAGFLVSVISESLGYLNFLGLLANDKVPIIISSSIFPSVAIFAVGFGLYGAIFQARPTVYEGLTLTLHELVVKEFEQLAVFLVKKAFSHHAEDQNRVNFILQNINTDELQTIYATQAGTPGEDLHELFVPLKEAIHYLRDGEIYDDCELIIEEIRICILEEHERQAKINRRRGPHGGRHNNQ